MDCFVSDYKILNSILNVTGSQCNSYNIYWCDMAIPWC